MSGLSTPDVTRAACAAMGSALMFVALGLAACERGGERPQELAGGSAPSLPSASGAAGVALRYLSASSAAEAAPVADAASLSATEALAAVRGATPETTQMVLSGAAEEVARADELFAQTWRRRAARCEGLQRIQDDPVARFLPSPSPEGELTQLARGRLEGAEVVRGRCDMLAGRRGRTVWVAVKQGRVVALRWDE